MTNKHNLQNLLVAFMALYFTVLPLSAATFGKFTYMDEGASITITGYATTEIGVVNIPAAIGGKPVVEIGNDAFSFCSILTRVTIPTSVTKIGDRAFRYCTSLTRMTIPTSMTSIGKFAFEGCNGLSNVTIPASVTSIGYSALCCCSALKTITVDVANTKYSSRNGILFNKTQNVLFQYPGGIVGSYRVPANVTSIRSGAFGGCIGLTSITIPANVTSIGDVAFGGCSGLTAITVDSANPNYSNLNGTLFDKTKSTLIKYPEALSGGYSIPASVTRIGASAFGGCVSLTSVAIPSSVTSIGDFAFGGCGGLTSVTIPSSLKSIGNSVFSNCSLTSVTIPTNITSISGFAFYGCIKLTTAKFLGNAPSMNLHVFDYTAPGFTINYITGNTGFTSPKWKGYPCVGVAATPEIDVQQPLGTSLVDGTAKKSFGTVMVGQSGTAKTFTIKYTGTGNLNGIAVIKDGANAGNFIITPPTKTTLPPGDSTTFKVTFKPIASGTRTAAIHIQSNDADKNPFDITLTGMGAP